MTEKEERIRETAYFIWLEEGCPEGQAERHWRDAQRIVEAQKPQQKSPEGESEPPAEYVTPLATLTRARPDTSVGSV